MAWHGQGRHRDTKNPGVIHGERPSRWQRRIWDAAFAAPKFPWLNEWEATRILGILGNFQSCGRGRRREGRTGALPGAPTLGKENPTPGVHPWNLWNGFHTHIPPLPRAPRALPVSQLWINGLPGQQNPNFIPKSWLVRVCLHPCSQRKSHSWPNHPRGSQTSSTLGSFSHQIRKVGINSLISQDWLWSGFIPAPDPVAQDPVG